MPSSNLGDIIQQPIDDVAIVEYSCDSERTFSFRDVHELANGFASLVLVEQGARVGILADNSVEFIGALLGIMRKGAVVVPLSTKFTANILDAVVENLAVDIMFADENNGNRLASIPLKAEKCSEFETSDVADDDTALVLCTSGSTGIPKGVALSHMSQKSMIERVAPMLGGLTGIVAAPLYHMNALLIALGMLSGGGRTILLPKFDARTYLQAIHDHGVNVVTGVPTMLSMMLKEKDLIESLDFSSVFAVQIGSAPLTESVIEQTKSLFPNAMISNGYGTTEAGSMIFGPHPEGKTGRVGTLGYPQPHVEVRLVGGKTPDEGVLQVKTPSAMTEYIGQPEKTSEKLTADGFVDTGDVMSRDSDGFYYFVGRNDDMFVCGGENVYPGEIERILESEARIQDCCVVPLSDEVKGAVPVAFIVTKGGTSLEMQEVKDLVLKAAPAFMHPRMVWFLDEMPLAGPGKIDRKMLESQAQSFVEESK